jgi:hypothetical protein
MILVYVLAAGYTGHAVRGTLQHSDHAFESRLYVRVPVVLSCEYSWRSDPVSKVLQNS